MSEQGKHTAGPWEVEHIFNAISPSVVSVADRANDLLTEKDAEICIIGQCSDLCRAEANAHLIAAAPDLYVALKETAHALGLLILASGDFCVLNAKAIDAANAALAKAEGRA